jgi:hydroxylamine reductase (hybrid-cluster protein)
MTVTIDPASRQMIERSHELGIETAFDRALTLKPCNIDREIVEIMHRTHIGVDQDYKHLMKQGTRAAIVDGWGGSMLATELQDILFGTPYPVRLKRQPQKCPVSIIARKPIGL